MLTKKENNDIINNVKDNKESRITKMKLELNFKYKGKKRYFYGNTIEEVALDSFVLFNNDEHAN